MVTQSEAFLLSEGSHTAVEVVRAREVEDSETKLAFRVNFDVDSSVFFEASVTQFADAHIHFGTFVTHSR